jgi:hypothetical protein
LFQNNEYISRIKSFCSLRINNLSFSTIHSRSKFGHYCQNLFVFKLFFWHHAYHMKFIGIPLVIFCIISCTPKESKDKNVSASSYDSPAFSEKFNSYISVINYYNSEDKGSSWPRTLEKLNDQLANGSKIEDLHLGNFMWGIDQSVKVAIANAEKAPDLGDADKSLVNFGNELVEASKLLKQLEAYYKGKNYLDDQYRKADQLISQFDARQKRLDALYAALSKNISVIKAKRDDYFVSQHKKEGRLIRYHMLLSMKYVRHAFALIDEGNFEKEFTDNYNKLAASVDELQSLALDEKALAKSNIELKSTFENYLSSLTTIKGNLRLLNDPKLDNAGRLKLIQQLDDDFSMMVDDYNRL